MGEIVTNETMGNGLLSCSRSGRPNYQNYFLLEGEFQTYY